MHFRFLISLILCGVPSLVLADFRFSNIDGGEIALDDYKGKAVLVVNTASKCGFTKQYDGLQTLYETYGEDGLVVLAVPSDDFSQELNSEDQVKDFCEVNFGLTIPMTTITSVKGRKAHPFYQWLNTEHRFEPRWNFYKVLLDQNGGFVASYASTTRPMSSKLTRDIETLLN